MLAARPLFVVLAQRDGYEVLLRFYKSGLIEASSLLGTGRATWFYDEETRQVITSKEWSAWYGDAIQAEYKAYLARMIVA